MTITYGDRMLAAAEARARKRSARRRRVMLMVPSVSVALWAMADVVAARNARLSADGAGLFRALVDWGAVGGWSIAFVVVPLLLALKRDPLPSGALLAALAGPVLTPMLFAHGWRPWQTATLFAIALLVTAAARERRVKARA